MLRQAVWCERGELNPHGKPLDSKSSASTNSATLARIAHKGRSIPRIGENRKAEGREAPRVEGLAGRGRAGSALRAAGAGERRIGRLHKDGPPDVHGAAADFILAAQASARSGGKSPVPAAGRAGRRRFPRPLPRDEPRVAAGRLLKVTHGGQRPQSR